MRRFDWVQPDLDAAYSRTPGVPGGSDKSFEVITRACCSAPSSSRTRQVQLQYAHYFLGNAAYPPYPYAWVARADANMVGCSPRCGGNFRERRLKPMKRLISSLALALAARRVLRLRPRT